MQALVCLTVALTFIAAAKAPTITQIRQTAPADQVVRTLCDKRIALLGESPTHGFGNTLEFKSQLVRRLVEQCHFNALFFESGLYDFLHIQGELRSGHDIPASMISAAIGGIWANEEVRSLIPFLREQLISGRLTLGGLDDQLGAGTYASKAMASDLVQPLPQSQRPRCLAILQRHLQWQYTEAAPYGTSDKQNLLGCLHQIETHLSSATDAAQSAAEAKAMVESLERNISRTLVEDDFTNKDQELKWFNDRDRSMYLNFEWLLHRLPPHSKIIVWAATVHTANDLSAVEGSAGRTPLGSYIHKDWRNQAFSLGFSACSGEYAFTHQPAQRLPDAPLNSAEAITFARTSSDTVYLSGAQLRTFGAVPARLLGPNFKTARWDQVVDGLVLFRTERAPTWITPQSR